MWSMIKRSCQRAFFGLVFKYFTIFFLVLICCSFSTKQTSEVEQRRSYITARKPSLKRLGLQIQYPTCLTNLENADENDMTKRSRLKVPQVNVLKKDFHSPDAGSKIKRMRRDTNPAPPKDYRGSDSSTLSRSSADNSADKIMSTIPIQSSTPTVPLLSPTSPPSLPPNLLDNFTSTIPIESATPTVPLLSLSSPPPLPPNLLDNFTSTIQIQSSTPTVPLLFTPSLVPLPPNLLDNITSTIQIQSSTPAVPLLFTPSLVSLPPNLLDNITSTIQIQSSTPAVPLLFTPSLAPLLPNLLDNITSSIPLQSPTPPVSDEDVNITMHCQSYWFSCRGRCTQEKELGGTEERLQCFCDRSCEFFKDCCADFDKYCSSSGISAEDINNPDDNGLWECVSSHGSFTKAAGVWMIASCPRKWTQVDIKERCGKHLFPSYDNLKDNVPVIDGEGKTYKNHYCARCHGLNLTDLTFYNFQLDCDVPVPKEYKRKEILSFVSTFCDRPLWRPPTGATRRYCHSVRSNHCQDSSLHPKVQQKCLNGSLRLVYQTSGSEKTTFFNPYCAICSYLKKAELRCGPGPYTTGEDGTLAKPFSLVMDLDFSDQDHRWRETSKVRGLKVTCRKGYVYDFHLEACRPGIAPSDVATVREETFIVSVWMRSKVQALSPWWPLITKVNFKEAIANKLKMNKSLISNISIGNPSGPVSTVVFNININITKQKNISTKSLQTAMSSLSIILNYANFTFFKVTVKPFHCAKVETFRPNEYTEFAGNAVRVSKTGEIFQEADYYTNETEWINGSLVPIGILTVCKQPRLNCSGVLVGLKESEYIMLSNGSLYRKDSRELFEPERFLLNNDTIWVCAKSSSNYEVNGNIDRPSKTDGDVALVVLTYAGLSLSIVSFVLVLVTYSLFKELRTVPGISLMNLSLSHLLVDLLYLATGYVEAKVACTIIAILLHYFFLVSFMWMLIIAFETWKAFSKTRIQRRNSSRRKQWFTLLRRIAVGWLPAFVFVVVCVALDQSNTVAFHYGGIKGCWINNSIANLFSFVLPVALSISFNTVFFVLTVNAIRKTNKQAQRAIHETVNRKTAVVFLKIFILMGFTWIFGFFKVLISHYFEYPFIIFTTLQGLYVALAFVFTSRVKQMYRTLFCIAKINSGSGSEDTRL